MKAKAATNPILQLIHRVVEDPKVAQLPDRDLLERFQAQQDHASFHTLLRRHGPMVLDVCRGLLSDGPDAEDAFQATFLVLAQKSGSIRKGASLGSWLHGVAHCTALKARTRSAVRQKHEARAPQRQASEADDLSWREVRQVLHEELGGLPERYREPLVMCYLQSARQQCAAARLGLAERTLRERLERGRELLRRRLVRRGLGLGAVLAVAAWPAGAVSAAIPAALGDSTLSDCSKRVGFRRMIHEPETLSQRPD
jgi:RNA polymerase sigma factor (sigma-70 family)